MGLNYDLIQQNYLFIQYNQGNFSNNSKNHLKYSFISSSGIGIVVFDLAIFNASFI